MGIFGLFRRSKPGRIVPSQPQPSSTKGQRPTPQLTWAASFGESQLIQVAGTTTNSKDAAIALVQRHKLRDQVALYGIGALRREPESPFDSDAVAVLVEGERIGYVPGYVAKTLSLTPGASLVVSVQLFCANLGTKVRVEAFAWLGDDNPQWQYSTDNPPAMSPEQKRKAEQESRSEMVDDALAGGGSRAEQFRAGMVQGVHYLELIEPIKELKREGKLEEGSPNAVLRRYRRSRK